MLLGFEIASEALTNVPGDTARSVRFECDCLVMVDQVNGMALRNKGDLKPLFERARDELE